MRNFEGANVTRKELPRTCVLQFEILSAEKHFLAHRKGDEFAFPVGIGLLAGLSRRNSFRGSFTEIVHQLNEVLGGRH